MKKKALSLLILLCLAYAHPANAIIGKVIGITDGDTITVLENKTQYKIRLYGIDCPESRQGFGKRAKQFASSIAFGKTANVVKEDTDRYGRTVGIVYVGDICVNEEIIRNGFAWVYQKYCKKAFCQDWLELEELARNDKKGLWSHADPIPPWDFRKGRTSNSLTSNPLPGLYHGNVKSMVFHQVSCKHFNCKNCIVPIDTREKAIEEGFRPCGICRP